MADPEYELPEDSAPIDEAYYHCNGPSSNFRQMFNEHVCSYDDLFNNFHPTIVQANSTHGDGEEASDMVGASFEHKKQSL